MIVKRGDIRQLNQLSKLFRRASLSIVLEYGKEALDMTFDESHLSEALKENRLFILTDKSKILGYMIISLDVKKTFFPLSLSLEKETNLFLKTNQKKIEPYAIIESLMIDPSYQNKGLGKELFSFLKAQYRDGVILSLLNKENKKALHFFRKEGSLARGLIEVENHTPKKMVLISYRLHEKTVTYKDHNRSHL